MKTFDYLRQYIPVITISMVLIASTLEAGAKNHPKESKREIDREHGCEQYHPCYYKMYHHSQAKYYDHPKYGRVYKQFEQSPIVIKHPCGEYYYSGNNFYRYHDGIGYCVEEPPRNQYFRSLPVECRKVYVNGQLFFRNGNLFFQLSPRGYVWVPSPIEIRFSARF